MPLWEFTVVSRIMDGLKHAARVSLESARETADQLCDTPPLSPDDYIAILDSRGEVLERWEAAFDGPGGGDGPGGASIWRLVLRKEPEPIPEDEPPEGSVEY